MGKLHLEQWVTEVYVPSISRDEVDEGAVDEPNAGAQDLAIANNGSDSAADDTYVLVIDSWSTFTEGNIRGKIPIQKKVSISLTKS